MSDRYTRIFSYKENTYTAGSPVIIAAGALLLDNTTNNVLAQLKFQSVSENKIKALTVEITQLDVAGRAMGEKIKHQYLDFNVGIGETFGAKVAIPLRDNSARSFLVTVEEAVFEDNSVWESTDVAWEELPSTEKNITDFELLKQFEMKYGIVYENHFKQEKDLWQCFCGAVNKNSKCYKCGGELSVFEKFDVDALKNECEVRLAEEQREKERLEEEIRIKREKEKAKADRIAKTIKKIAIITTPIVSAVVAFVIILNTVIIPNVKYNDAVALMGEKKYTEAAEIFMEISSYKDSLERFTSIRSTTISAGNYHTVALKNDGTVVATRYTGLYDEDYDGQCAVESWKNIIAISAGGRHTVGLKSNGTVVATKAPERVDDQIPFHGADVDSWHDIIAVSAGYHHTVGLKSDGTVVATVIEPERDYGQCDVESWKNIVAISAGQDHTVGLKSDGTVVITGNIVYQGLDVEDWTDIIAISAGKEQTVGLKADGTVVATGDPDNELWNVEDWTDIVAVAAGGDHVIGLRSDGTVVAIGDNDYGQCVVDGWKDVVAVSAGEYHTVGLKADGTVVASAYPSNYDYNCGQCDVDDWKDIMIPKR